MYAFSEEVPLIEIEKIGTRLVSDMPAEHVHSYYEMYFLLSGERRYFIGGEIYNVAPGNLVIVPKNVIHRTLAFHQKGYDRYVIYFSEASVAELKRELGDDTFAAFLSLGCVQLPNEEVLAMRERCERLFAEQMKNDPFRYSAQRSLLSQMIIAALRYGKKKGCAVGDSEDKIRLVAHYMQENFSEPLTLEDAARMACMERTYFSKRFKALTGFNFSSYLTQLRLSAARQLLLNTDMNISEIAAHAGFSGSNYFGDVFLRAYGMSPTEYRKRREEK